ncbi:MAG: hypothetical protein WB608_12590 [Terracidiphilus sp.]
MERLDTPINRFFRDFESANSSGDIPAIVSQFAETFMAASPQGTQAVCAADFALALPKRKQLFESLGCRSTALVSVQETQLDPRYTMARTRWEFTFIRDQADPQQVLVDSTFIVDTAAGIFKIVFYLANQDIMAILKERGLLPV